MLQMIMYQIYIAITMAAVSRLQRSIFHLLPIQINHFAKLLRFHCQNLKGGPFALGRFHRYNHGLKQLKNDILIGNGWRVSYVYISIQYTLVIFAHTHTDLISL